MGELLDHPSSEAELFKHVVEQANNLLGSIAKESAVSIRSPTEADIRVSVREGEKQRIVFYKAPIERIRFADRLPALLAEKISDHF